MNSSGSGEATLAAHVTVYALPGEFATRSAGLAFFAGIFLATFALAWARGADYSKAAAVAASAVSLARSSAAGSSPAAP